MTRSDDAAAYFNEGFSCSQAVLSSFSEDLGLDKETARKISCGFGAGMARSGNICGVTIECDNIRVAYVDQSNECQDFEFYIGDGDIMPDRFSESIIEKITHDIQIVDLNALIELSR